MAKLPDIAPHTTAKHLILKRYLDAWFPILGKYHPTINYLDGFAGPGEYENGQEGSPLIAIRSALAHVQSGALPQNIKINFAFVEADPEQAAHLKERLTTLEVPAGFNVIVLAEPFREAAGALVDSLEKNQTALAPTFSFVDPFGFKGIPFSLIARLLKHPRAEIFINIMVDFINRFLEHPNEAVASHFPETFGTREVLEIPGSAGDRKRAILDLYKRQLTVKARFVGQFDMLNQRNSELYSLFFATNSDKGFLKMKEAMWSVDQGAGSMFSDADPSAGFHPTLFHLSDLKAQLRAQFQGRLVPMNELEGFVIAKTNHLPKHARSVLKEMEKLGEVKVVAKPDYKRPAGTFKVDKIAIQF